MDIKSQNNTVQYLGSKFSVLPWLLKYLPYTKTWVDLFGGSMVVTINKAPSPIEIYNDLNEEVTNFFKVLRSHTEELITQLHLTPYSRQEYEMAWFKNDDTDIEKARKFFVRLRQSYLATGAMQQTKGWGMTNNLIRRGISENVNKWLNGVNKLNDITNRLKRVQIENKDFEYIINFYDTAETLIYADPPYDDEKVSGVNQYKHKFGFVEHIRLHECLLKCKGKVAVSGYDSDFMKDLYPVSEGWNFISGPKPKNHSRKSAAKECLWLNYNPEFKTTLF